MTRNSTSTQSIIALLNVGAKIEIALNHAANGKDNDPKTYAKEQQNYQDFKRSYVLSAEEMCIVLAAKKLNCTVIDDISGIEVKAFFSKLINRSDELTNQRFQAIIQSGDAKPHWSIIDINISKEHGIEIFHFDPIISKTQVENNITNNGSKIEGVLLSLPNNKEKPIKIFHSYSPLPRVNGKKELIQKDQRSCSIFALSGTLTMSKMNNLHDLVRNKAEIIYNHPDKSFIQYQVDVTELPASLLKSCQSYLLIDHYEEKHKDNQEGLNQIGKKASTLKEYTDAHSHEDIPLDNNPEKRIRQNLSIFFKRDKYKELVAKTTQAQTSEGPQDTDARNTRFSGPN